MNRVPPSLGSRGQGWVALQFALLGLALLVGLLDLSGWGPSYAGGLRYLGVLVMSAGVVLAVFAVLGLGSSLTALPAPVEHGTLRTDGVYGVVRHPIYSALLLVVLGWALASSPWVLLVWLALAVELDLKRQVEEDFLERTYDDYRAYRERVRWALVPYVR
ncbi:MAG: isoprenylcysteine carboxylmethyltransferase family protein [Candidatus Nanopelagicales bacterium]